MPADLAANRPIFKPRLTCFEHTESGLPGVRKMKKLKLESVQRSISGAYFVAIGMAQTETHNVLPGWEELGTFVDSVEELLRQAVVLVNHVIQHAIITTGLYAALSFERELFQNAEALELEELVR
jgi:hypothetical protein